MDYRKLLIRYLAVISECEGINYIWRARADGMSIYGVAGMLTDEEADELDALSESDEFADFVAKFRSRTPV